MNLTLERPIIFFDLETTGTNVTNDRIVEISLIKVTPEGEETERTRRINPGIPIPAEATAIHHITDDDVRDEPRFEQVARSLAAIFHGCDIAGFNSNRFDIPMLKQEFDRAGVELDLTGVLFIDVQTIFHKREPRNLTAAYRFYCGKDLEQAHSANADTRATYEVLKAQLEKYSDLPRDMKALSEYTSYNRNVDLMGLLVYDDAGRELINFGKHRGRPAADVLRTEPGYFGWIMQGDFTDDTKSAFQRIYNRVKGPKTTC